jgi:hypothetical protein
MNFLHIALLQYVGFVDIEDFGKLRWKALQELKVHSK